MKKLILFIFLAGVCWGQTEGHSHLSYTSDAWFRMYEKADTSYCDFLYKDENNFVKHEPGAVIRYGIGSDYTAGFYDTVYNVNYYLTEKWILINKNQIIITMEKR